MKKRRKFNILIFVVIVGLGLAARYLSGVVPYWECSGVYRHYAHKDGVEASFVRGFPVNDTLGVDVTLLRAADSAGWECLMEEFNISKERREVAEEIPEFRMAEWQCPRNHPETIAATQGKDRIPGLTEDDIEICAMDFEEREICIFHTRNAQEARAVRNYNFYKMEDNEPVYQ